MQARNLTPALSVAGAICDHLRDWILGTPEGTWVSMGVRSDGSYGVPEGLFFSFPVTCRSGQWDCVQVTCPRDKAKRLCPGGSMLGLIHLNERVLCEKSLVASLCEGAGTVLQGLAVSADLQHRLQACVEEAQHEQQ